MFLILYQYNSLHITVLITGYNITISSTSVSCSTTVSGDALQYTFTGLDHTQQYTVSVAAINCAGTGSATQLQPNLNIDAMGNKQYNSFS